MPIDYGSSAAGWVSLPKAGEEPKEFMIKKAEKIVDPDYKFNFMKKEERKLDDGTIVKIDVNQGFRLLFTMEDDTKLSMSQWLPYYAFSKANVQEGDHIRVHHPAKGEWKVEKLNQAVEAKPTTKTASSAKGDINWDE